MQKSRLFSTLGQSFSSQALSPLMRQSRCTFMMPPSWPSAAAWNVCVVPRMGRLLRKAWWPPASWLTRNSVSRRLRSKAGKRWGTAWA
jgi:hypothetical protein